LSGINSNDGFEEELNEISASKDGKRNITGRAALFLKGKVKGEYLLTLAYDSDKDKTKDYSVIFVQMNITQFMVTLLPKALMLNLLVNCMFVSIKDVHMQCMVTT
jgi:hypothetical protein